MKNGCRMLLHMMVLLSFSVEIAQASSVFVRRQYFNPGFSMGYFPNSLNPLELDSRSSLENDVSFPSPCSSAAKLEKSCVKSPLDGECFISMACDYMRRRVREAPFPVFDL